MQESRGKKHWRGSLGLRQGVLKLREAPGLYFSGIRKEATEGTGTLN